MHHAPLHICLVSDAELVRTAVRLACPPPHEVVVFSLTNVLNDQHAFSEQGERVVEAAAGADVVLVGWVPAQAPLLNTLCHHVRQRARVPVMALCAGGGQEEMIAALAAGADDVLAFPIYLPLLQSKIAACRRLMDAVRQATSIDLEPEPEKQRRNRVVTKDETRVNDGRKRARAPLSLNGGSGRNDAPLPEARSSEVREEPDASPPPPSPPRPEQDEGLVVGPLRLDLQAFRFFVHGEEVELTPKEFDLIRYLMQHAGTVCPRDQILDEVWGLDFDTGTNMVDVYMHFLRRKLAAHGLKGMIKTIRGRGYRLDGQPTPAPHPGSSSPQ